MAKTEAGKNFLKSLGVEFYETEAAKAFEETVAKSNDGKGVGADHDYYKQLVNLKDLKGTVDKSGLKAFLDKHAPTDGDDRRYTHVSCPECGLKPQNIDWKNPTSHKPGCSIPQHPWTTEEGAKEKEHAQEEDGRHTLPGGQLLKALHAEDLAVAHTGSEEKDFSGAYNGGLTGKVVEHHFAISNASTGKRLGRAVVLAHPDHPIGAAWASQGIADHLPMGTRATIGRQAGKLSGHLHSVEWDQTGSRNAAITKAEMWDRDRMAASVGLTSVAKTKPFDKPKFDADKEHARNMSKIEAALAARPVTKSIPDDELRKSGLGAYDDFHDAINATERTQRLERAKTAGLLTNKDLAVEHSSAAELHRKAAVSNPQHRGFFLGLAANHDAASLALHPVTKSLAATERFEAFFMEEDLENGKKSKLGSGKRFKAIEEKAKSEGEDDPAAVAAAVGRKKYGTKKMGALAAAGRKRASKAINFYLDKLEKGSGKTQNFLHEDMKDGPGDPIDQDEPSYYETKSGKPVCPNCASRDDMSDRPGEGHPKVICDKCSNTINGGQQVKKSLGATKFEEAVEKASKEPKDWKCQECGHKMTLKSAEKASMGTRGCIKCGGSDIDLDHEYVKNSWPDTKKSLGVIKFEEELRKSPRRKYSHPWDKYPGMPPEIVDGWKMLTGKTATGPDPMKSKSGITPEGKMHNWTDPNHPLHAAKIAFDWQQGFTKTSRFVDTKYNQHSNVHKERLAALGADSGVKRKAEIQENALRGAQSYMENQKKHGGFHTPYPAISVARGQHMENSVGRSHFTHEELGHISDAMRDHPQFAHLGDEVHHRLANFENFHEDAADAHEDKHGSTEGYHADATNIHPQLLSHMNSALGDSKNQAHAGTYNIVHAAHEATKAHPAIGALTTDNRKNEV